MDNLICIDHTSKLGGGELALSRFIAWPGRQYHIDLILFEEGPLADIARSAPKTDVYVLSAKTKLHRLSQLSKLIKRLDGLILANSYSSFVYMSLLPKELKRTIYYLRHEAITKDTPWFKALFLKKYSFRLARGFLANSSYTQNTLQDLSLMKKCQVVYTISGILYDEMKDTPNKFRDPLQVLSLSRLTSWKGIHLIAQAVNKVNQDLDRIAIRLTIAGGALFGENDYRMMLEGYKDDSKGAIDLIGHVDDVKPLLEKHDVLLSASTRPEPFGQVLVQGLSAGLLTIGTAQGGAAEVIQDEVNGLLLPPGDINALCSILEKIVEAPSSFIGLRKAALVSAEKFTDEKMYKLLDNSIQIFEFKKSDCQP
ncbi:glycosyltransferase family 4 protein [Rothia nasimurium]|uniref:glycosyltransferase family 4 protein n=1 Tax=Rothia nasimurium TaxID=85336 RepID=UPI001F39094E|nr:glycosyltransferase family 4 protein [Rothia nasimurium]